MNLMMTKHRIKTIKMKMTKMTKIKMKNKQLLKRKIPNKEISLKENQINHSKTKIKTNLKITRIRISTKIKEDKEIIIKVVIEITITSIEADMEAKEEVSEDREAVMEDKEEAMEVIKVEIEIRIEAEETSINKEVVNHLTKISKNIENDFVVYLNLSIL